MKKHVFKVGDHVFYPGAGVGTIETEEDIFLGDAWQPCFIIRICDNPLTIKMPKMSVERTGIRPLLSCNRVRDLFKVLADKTGERTGSNWTEHYKDLERKINSGSCMQLGEVVRDLMRLKKRNGLSFEEARLLETAICYLSREISMIEGITPETALDRIRDQVAIGV
ncbi:MAG: CarD family transcriptional regulator [Acidiferrobacteraceae bacterium]